MFSFGIVLCEILARVPADPEILPRTQVNMIMTIMLADLIVTVKVSHLHLY